MSKIRTIRFAGLLLLSLSLSPGLVFGRDIFVNNTSGDDALTGRFPTLAQRGEGPLKTLARALAVASKGDRIVIADTGVPYRESVTLQAGRNSGFPDQPFIIEGNGAILDGSAPVPPDAWEHFRGEVFRFQPAQFSFQQLFLNDVPVQRRFVGTDGEFPELQPLEWFHSGPHIYFRPEEDRLPDSYELTYAMLPVGLGLYEVRHVWILDLVVQGFHLDGVNAHDSVFDCVLQGLTCRGNGRSGISIGGASRVTIRDCLVGDNGAAQVRTEGYSRTWIDGSELLDQTAPKLVRDGGQVTVVDAEP